MAVQSFPTLLPTDLAPDYISPEEWLANYQNAPFTQMGGSSIWNAAGGLDTAGPAYDPNMVYRFDTGGTGASGDTATPVVFQPGQTYTLTDSSHKTIGTATTPEEMQALVNQANARGSWNLYQGDVKPGAELAQQTNYGSLGSMLLPMAAVAAIPFAAQALGAFAAPAAATGTTAGVSPAIAAAIAKDAAFTAGLGSTAAGISSGLASGALAAGMTIPELTALGSTFGEVAAPAATVAATEAPIVVSGAPAAASHLPAWAEAFAAPAISSGVTASMLADAAATQPAANPSLLDQVLKYGSLASLAANGIGSLLGGGTGTSAGVTAPYTSVLGPAPTFGRGAVQSFTGNYETYGQGPEWNFFAPQPTTGG